MALLEPVAPLDAKSPFGFGRIEEDEACRPAVRNCKFVQECGDFGPRMEGKAGQADQANVKVIQHGLKASMEFMIAEQNVEKVPLGRRPEGIGACGDAGVEVRQERTIVHALHQESGAQSIFILREAAPEEIERLLPIGCSAALEEQARGSRLHLGGWRPRESQREATLEVLAFLRVVQPALVIYQRGDGVRKSSGLRIADARFADEIDVHHPAVAQPRQTGIYLMNESRHLLRAC